MYLKLVPAVTLSDDIKLGNNEKTASRDQGDSDSVTALEAQVTGLTLVSSSASNLNFPVWYKPSPAPTSTAQPSTLPPPPALPVRREDSSLERYPVPPVPNALLDPSVLTFPNR